MQEKKPFEFPVQCSILSPDKKTYEYPIEEINAHHSNGDYEMLPEMEHPVTCAEPHQGKKTILSKVNKKNGASTTFDKDSENISNSQSDGVQVITGETDNKTKNKKSNDGDEIKQTKTDGDYGGAALGDGINEGISLGDAKGKSFTKTNQYLKLNTANQGQKTMKCNHSGMFSVFASRLQKIGRRLRVHWQTPVSSVLNQ